MSARDGFVPLSGRDATRGFTTRATRMENRFERLNGGLPRFTEVLSRSWGYLELPLPRYLTLYVFKSVRRDKLAFPSSILRRGKMLSKYHPMSSLLALLWSVLSIPLIFGPGKNRDTVPLIAFVSDNLYPGVISLIKVSRLISLTHGSVSNIARFANRL